MHIDKLPLVPLVKIFSYIDDFSDKIALERVCRKWHQTVHLDWEQTKTCPKPLCDKITLGLVLNRCGEWLEELWLYNLQIDENLVKQMAKWMKCLKHLKLSKCYGPKVVDSFADLSGPAVNSIADLFGQQLCSFILDETNYHPNMSRMIENESSKLEHLQIFPSLYNFGETLPTKLPNNLKSFSLKSHADPTMLLWNMARDCKNLKVLHLEIGALRSNMIVAIGNIKSLVYLNLAFNLIANEIALKNVICHELPNLKALNIRDYSKNMSNICRERPDLVHLNVFVRHPFQIPDSLNSLTLQIHWSVDAGQFLPALLFNQQNKSIQHLDIRTLVLPSSSNFIKNLLGQFPDLKSIHCKKPDTNADLASFFSLIEKHLKKGRKITIYFHFGTAYHDPRYHKYILPDDLPQFDIGWRPEECKGKCENLVLKKLIKEAVDGGNEPSFLDDWWME